MYTNEDTIKLFDANNNFVADFDSKIEEIEISIHGENYFDVDEINKILEDYLQGDSDLWRKVWTIYTFLVWYDVYFNNIEID